MNVSKHNIQIIQCIIQYYLAYQKPGNLTNAKGKRKSVVANPEMIQMLELLNTLKVTITIFHEIKVNTLEIKGKIDILRREVETKYLPK